LSVRAIGGDLDAECGIKLLKIKKIVISCNFYLFYLVISNKGCTFVA
jgi:hypothetical protein